MNRRSFLAATALALAARPAAARAPLHLHDQPLPLLSPPIHDGQGNALTLADFAGRFVLLNTWATWRPPCRDEMPALNRLQSRLGGDDFTILALCTDNAGPDAARAFYTDHGIATLGLYWAEDLRARLALGVVGLPTTLLIDRSGQEISRLNGPADWDSADAVTQISTLIGGA